MMKNSHREKLKRDSRITTVEERKAAEVRLANWVGNATQFSDRISQIPFRDMQ